MFISLFFLSHTQLKFHPFPISSLYLCLPLLLSLSLFFLSLSLFLFSLFLFFFLSLSLFISLSLPFYFFTLPFSSYFSPLSLFSLFSLLSLLSLLTHTHTHTPFSHCISLSLCFSRFFICDFIYCVYYVGTLTSLPKDEDGLKNNMCKLFEQWWTMKLDGYEELGVNTLIYLLDKSVGLDDVSVSFFSFVFFRSIGSVSKHWSSTVIWSHGCGDNKLQISVSKKNKCL